MATRHQNTKADEGVHGARRPPTQWASGRATVATGIEVQHDRRPEAPCKQRVEAAARKLPAERHRLVLPAAIGRIIFEEHLKISSDSLDAGVQREDNLEGEGQDRAVAGVWPPAARPAPLTPTVDRGPDREADQRNPDAGVERSRIVSRSARYSSISRAVMRRGLSRFGCEAPITS